MPNNRRDKEQFFKALARRKRELADAASTLARQAGILMGSSEPAMATPSAVRTAAEDKLRKWSQASNEMLHSLDTGFRFITLHPGQSLNIQEVYEKGIITAEFHDRGKIYRLYVAPGSSEASCSCQRPSANRVCQHVVHLLKRVHGDLKDITSELSKRIIEQKWSTVSWDSQRFTLDLSTESLRSLDMICASMSDIDISQNLPTSNGPQEVQRVAWNVHLLARFDLDCMIQSMYKRGTGWKRGQILPISSIFDDSLPLSPADKRVRAHVSFDDVGVQIKPVQILHELIGADNVFLHHEPAHVLPMEPVLAVVQKGPENHFGFALEQQLQWNACKLLFDPDGMMLVSTETQKIAVCLCPAPFNETLRRLINLEPIHQRHCDQLFNYVKKLQETLSIKLPESVAGPTVPDTLHPLIALRASPEGRLDYGIRVRDASEVLQRPGQGRLIRASTVDGNPVQHVRCGNVEVQHGSQLATKLQIPVRNWDGECPDLASSIQLLTRLREHAQETEILWDPTTACQPRFAGTISAKNVQVKIEKKRDWFQLSGETRLGDSSIPLASLIEAIDLSRAGEGGNSLVRLNNDTWAEISTELRTQLESLHSATHTERGSIKFDRSSAQQIRALQSTMAVDAPKAWLECLERLERAEQLDPQLPANLQATLREYQTEGFQWMCKLAEWGVGGILADDMGLGKTIQTLAVILNRSAQGPCLVIAPTSVAFNWMREIERFAPGLTAHLYRETDRDGFLNELGPNQIVVCSYGLALRDADKLKEVGWHTMVLDEAQAIKNSRSKTSQAIAAIPADWTVALTGTPVENHLGELWSLFHVVSPGIFGGWEHFRNRFAGPIEKQDDMERREALRKRIQPFVLRRTKREVLRDLPPRTESNLYVELSPAERKRYDQVRLSSLAEAMSIAKLPDVQDQRFKILALLTRLRQLACNPKLVDAVWSDGSAKLDLLRDTLIELKDEGHRVLVFSQFVQHLQLIRQMLDEEKITYQYLDGSTPADQRAREVDAFQNGDATAFLISLKAGGTGLNLTAADYVIHMDPWWNPAVEDQATDRAHRIGQTKPVIVYRIIAQGTIEEEILKLHDTKRDLIAGVLDGTQAAAKLSTADLIAMIRQET
jgi:superfamily II DNA or RNA helicase